MGDEISKQKQKADCETDEKPATPGFHTFRRTPSFQYGHSADTLSKASAFISGDTHLRQYSTDTQIKMDDILLVADTIHSGDDTDPDNDDDYKSSHSVDGLHFIPQENVVEDIGLVFKYMKQLGSGASCRVLKAQHIESQEIFAVKEMLKADDSNLLSFVKERQLLRKLVHPVLILLTMFLQTVSVPLSIFRISSNSESATWTTHVECTRKPFPY